MILESVKKIVAVNFAEWLAENEWVKRYKTHPKHVGKYWSNITCEYKTIEELYDIFRNDEQKMVDSLKT